jgi:hypothetical protein
MTINRCNPMGERRVLPAGVVRDTLDPKPEDQRDAPMAGLVLHIVARKVPDCKRIAVIRLRFDILD